jgi:hypothetical protein
MKLDADAIDRVADEVDTIVKQLARLGRQDEVRKAHRITFEHFDDGEDPEEAAEDYGDGDSNPSLEASEADGDYDEDGEDDELDKRSINEVVRTNDPSNRPGSRKTSDHSTWKTKTQAMVDHISRTENCPKTEALRRLRDRYPDIANGNPINKSAPPTFEDLVNSEMAKGVTREIAGQRIVQLHGYNAFAGGVSKRLVKGANAEYAFQKRVGEVMYEDDVDAAEATRRVRKEDPTLFAALQRSTRR